MQSAAQSMEVGIQIIAEDPQNPAMRRRTHRSFFTMVAMDAEGKPVEVPRLVCETPSDFEWRCEALLRKEARQRFNRELEGACRIEAMS